MCLLFTEIFCFFLPECQPHRDEKRRGFLVCCWIIQLQHELRISRRVKISNEHRPCLSGPGLDGLWTGAHPVRMTGRAMLLSLFDPLNSGPNPWRTKWRCAKSIVGLIWCRSVTLGFSLSYTGCHVQELGGSAKQLYLLRMNLSSYWRLGEWRQ